MLHILFVILKILAIIIASILGLLLFLLLIVLFVPIHYRADIRKNEEIVVKARVNWLLRIVFARIWFINQQLHLRLRVFGICIYDNLRPKKEKKPKKTSPNLKDKKVKKRGKKQFNSTSITSNQKAEDTIGVSIDQTVGHKVMTQVEEARFQNELARTQNEESSIQSKITNTHIQVSQKAEDLKEKEKPTEALKEEHTTSKGKGHNICSKIKVFFGKIKSIILKFLGLGAKIRSLVHHIKAKVNSVCELIKGLWEKKNKVTAFLKDDINKAGIKLAFRQVLMALKHCAPKKISGYIRYGTGDPCSTGEAFAVAACFYGKYGNSLKLVPDFEEEVLEAEVMVKGRIRIFSLLIIGIKLIRDKNFSKLLKNAKQLKEEL